MAALRLLQRRCYTRDERAWVAVFSTGAAAATAAVLHAGREGVSSDNSKNRVCGPTDTARSRYQPCVSLWGSLLSQCPSGFHNTDRQPRAPSLSNQRYDQYDREARGINTVIECVGRAS